MGTDPIPFWVNLYLSKHEYDFMGKLIRKDLAQGHGTFHGTFRFIDNLFALND